MIFELDQPQVLEFKHDVLAQHGATPSAERREIAVDLRDDWPQGLRDNGFDSSEPSAWIAEGLLIYLPATAQAQLFTGVDALAVSGSHIAVEDTVPLDAEVYAARRQESHYETADGSNFFNLVYNERHAAADQWLTERGWVAVATELNSYLGSLGRPVPADDSDEGIMSSKISLVSAIKR